MNSVTASKTSTSKKHWSLEICETLLSCGRDGLLHVTVLGGSDHGSFCWVSDVDEERVRIHSGRLLHNDIILEVQGEKVAGYTRQDLLEFLWSVSRNHSPVLIKTLSAAFLTKSLRQFLTARYKKDSLDHNLQQIVRKNIYRKALPCTTRPARQGELNGVDYKFLTVEEFLSLEKNGGLLESGIYNGNYYGTPKPPIPVHPPGKPYTGQKANPVVQCALSRPDEEKQGLSSSDAVHQSMERLEDKENDDRSSEASSLRTSSSNLSVAVHQPTVAPDAPRLTTSQSSSRVYEPNEKDRLTNLPYGWEKVTDPDYGVYYVDHINHRTQYDCPSVAANTADAVVGSGDETISSSGGSVKLSNLDKENQNASSFASASVNRPLRNNVELKGEFIRTRLTKTAHGFGFTIISVEDSNAELLQIKTILHNGPAEIDGRLKRGDVLVNVDTHCVIGFTHSDIISLFQSIPVGRRVTLEVCRGYPLPFDPDDPTTEVITTVAVSLPSARNISFPVAPLYHCNHSTSDAGVGFPSHSIPALPPPRHLPDHPSSSSAEESSTRSALTEESIPKTKRSVAGGIPQCPVELTVVIVKGRDGFGFTISDSSAGQKVKQIIDCERCRNLAEGDIIIKINGNDVKSVTHADVVEVLKSCLIDTETTFVVQRGGQSGRRRRRSTQSSRQKDLAASNGVAKISPGETVSKDTDENTKGLTQCSANAAVASDSNSSVVGSRETSKESSTTHLSDSEPSSEHIPGENGCASIAPEHPALSTFGNRSDVGQDVTTGSTKSLANDQKQDLDFIPRCCSPVGLKKFLKMNKQMAPLDHNCVMCQWSYDFQLSGNTHNGAIPRIDNFVGHMPLSHAAGGGACVPPFWGRGDDGVRMTIQLDRQETGFGIRIVGGIEEGSQVAVGYILPGGAADLEGHLSVGDEILAVNQQSVIGASHHQVVALMSQSARIGFVFLDVLKRAPAVRNEFGGRSSNAYDVMLSRREDEGFGFVIVSSVTKAGSVIGKIIEGSPASRCERLHIGDYILAINGVDIGNMPHQEIVNFIKASGFSIRLSVGPTNHFAMTPESRSSLSAKAEPPETNDVFQLIELKRGSKGFGFSIRGGKEFDGMPLYILKVADDGPAKMDGRLQVGDQIVEINRCNTHEMLHSDAIDLIQNSRASLILLVKRQGCVCKHPHQCNTSASNISNNNLGRNS